MDIFKFLKNLFSKKEKNKNLLLCACGKSECTCQGYCGGTCTCVVDKEQ